MFHFNISWSRCFVVFGFWMIHLYLLLWFRISYSFISKNIWERHGFILILRKIFSSNSSKKMLLSTGNMNHETFSLNHWISSRHSMKKIPICLPFEKMLSSNKRQPRVSFSDIFSSRLVQINQQINSTTFENHFLVLRVSVNKSITWLTNIITWKKRNAVWNNYYREQNNEIWTLSLHTYNRSE